MENRIFHNNESQKDFVGKKLKTDNVIYQHDVIAKRTSAIHRGLNGVSKVMFAFSMCDTTSGILHTAVVLPLFKKLLSLLE